MQITDIIEFYERCKILHPVHKQMLPDRASNLKALHVHTWLFYVMHHGHFNNFTDAEATIWPERVYDSGNNRAKVLDGYARFPPYSPRQNRLNEINKVVSGSLAWFQRPIWTILKLQIHDSKLLDYSRYARNQIGVYVQHGITDSVSLETLFNVFWQAEGVDDLEGLVLVSKVALQRGHYEIASEGQVAIWAQLIVSIKNTPLHESRFLQPLIKILSDLLEITCAVGFMKSLPSQIDDEYIQLLISALENVEHQINSTQRKSKRRINLHVARRSVWYKIFYLTGLKSRLIKIERSILDAFVDSICKKVKSSGGGSFINYCCGQDILSHLKEERKFKNRHSE